MQPYQRLLVPVDFSDVTPAVLATARRLLAEDGTAVLLHVVETLPMVSEATFGVYAHRRDLEEIKRLAREKLRHLAAEARDTRLVAEVREGKPAQEIVNAAVEHGSEVIVIGTQGRSRLDHLLVGSVTERVLRRAACNVFTVRG